MKHFSKSAVREELRVVALAFCEQAGNVRPDPTTGQLWLSKIFSWCEQARAVSSFRCQSLSFIQSSHTETAG